MRDILLGVAFFTGNVLIFVTAILVARRYLIPSGGVRIRINDKKTLKLPVGGKLLGALDNEGIRLSSACGGKGICSQCKVKVVSGRSSVVPAEQDLLSLREIREGTRLACQMTVHDDLELQVPDDVFGVGHWRCRVKSSRCVGTLLKEITLELPEGELIDFRAGAYIQVTCPPFDLKYRDFDIDSRFHQDWDQMGLWDLEVSTSDPHSRAYSMANYVDEKGIVVLNVRLATPPPGKSDHISPGYVSSYMYSLKPGDEIAISGPFGEFFAEDSDHEMIFIGGGAGMAPMRSHIFDQLKRLDSKRKISFWYGARNARELFYVEEFDQLQKEHDNFSWYVALSDPRPEEDWQGDTGFIHEVLYNRYLGDHANPEDCEYYLCGPPPMLNAVLKMLDSLGVDAENIRYDDFGG
ncbi:NADH:ubiquinone reductase (Na(+)-transporting) subunit F [Marinobacterium sp. D7]|uniref:NADH:ubiquinone reductase (Na(+)-transporting) subunit F n=1 Tax=Marinobacterium ramblicola TaxID=2849041 RepID=UPI001C2DA2A0|nr:NADH:ubiquinone reductase (Na(+)-transporting) subunit F [Marinobacterium ramblicola]MBV1790185.1 NADH:ubiquinone reductase (Na(+)-transporting) subunit F [Marinobacterium ramblicola]